MQPDHTSDLFQSFQTPQTIKCVNKQEASVKETFVIVILGRDVFWSRSPADARELLATPHDWPTTFQLVWPSVVRSTHLSAVFWHDSNCSTDHLWRRAVLLGHVARTTLRPSPAMRTLWCIMIYLNSVCNMQRNKFAVNFTSRAKLLLVTDIARSEQWWQKKTAKAVEKKLVHYHAVFCSVYYYYSAPLKLRPYALYKSVYY